MVRKQRLAFGTDLALALGGMAALVLAAAGPSFGARRSERVVRVVVSSGAPAMQTGYAERVEAALARLRAALGPEDRLEVVHVPGPEAHGPRPSPEALVAAARAGAPERSLVLSDVVVEEPDVHSLAVGDAALGNLGIVAAAWERSAGPAERSAGSAERTERVLVTLLNASPRPARAEVVLRGRAGPGPFAEQARRAVRLGADEVQAVLLERAGPATDLEVVLDHETPGGDALPADDRVGLHGAGLRVLIDRTRLSAAHVAAVRRALEAALGSAALVEERADAEPVDLRVERWPVEASSRVAGATTVLALAALDPNDPGVAVGAGPEQVRPHPFVRDVTLAGMQLWRPQAVAAGIRWWLQRASPSAAGAGDADQGAGMGGEGLIGEDAQGRVLVAFDVTRGAPSPAQRPAWPIFVENLVRTILGSPSDLPGQAGVRREGLLDVGSTRLGRETRALDAGWLAAAPVREVGAPRALAPWLGGVGLLLLGALWWREARRRGPAR